MQGPRERKKRVGRQERSRAVELLRADPKNVEARKEWAKALGITERTLRNWGEEDEAGRIKRLGRPRKKGRKIRRALRVLRKAWKKMTEGMEETAPGPGVPTLHEKCRKVSRYLTERLVAARKRRAKRIRLRAEKVSRRSVEVWMPDVIWSIDGKHLGREAGKRIEGHILRDRGSLDFLRGWVGTEVKSEILTPEILEMLKEAPPYVLQFDRDSRYREKGLRRGLRMMWIIPYISEPRTPQHNPMAEEGMRELDDFIPLGGVSSSREGAFHVSRAFLTLNRERPRLSRGGLSSEELYAFPRVEIDREVMYRYYVTTKRRLRREAEKGFRARCRADRRAVEVTLVAFGLARVSVGGVPLRVSGFGKN